VTTVGIPEPPCGYSTNDGVFFRIYHTCSVRREKNGPQHNGALTLITQTNTFYRKAQKFGIDCDGTRVMQSTFFFDYDKDGDLEFVCKLIIHQQVTSPCEYYQ